MKKRNILISLLFLLFLPVILILIANLSIQNNAKNKTFDRVSNIPNNKVGLVLGTSKFSKAGGINLYFQYRINAAVELYNNGKIDFILVSGDNENLNYNEPKDFKRELVKRGIPEERIFLDYAGFRTLDSVIRAQKVFGQDNITVISQKFQNERAIFLAEKKGLIAIGFNAEDPPGNYSFKTHIREYFARTKAFMDIIFNVKPRFLGEKIEIKLE